MRWFLPFTAFYVLWLALIANSSWELAYGDTAFGVPATCAELLLLGWTLWRNWQWNRGAEAAARAAVERLLWEHARAGEVACLDRDGHVRLNALRVGRFFWAAWVLARGDEDQFSEIARQGRAPVTVERYLFARAFPRVPRFVTGAMVTAGGDVDLVPEREPGLIWVARLTGLTGTGKGSHAFADAAELAGLAGQLREAEPVA